MYLQFDIIFSVQSVREGLEHHSRTLAKLSPIFFHSFYPTKIL